MSTATFDGPLHTSGDMQAIPAAVGGTNGAVPDPDTDAGPSAFFQGIAVPDVRYIYLKDKVQGYTGVVPALLAGTSMVLVNQIPAATSTTRIAAAAAVTNGTAMTLATEQAVGCAPGIPILPFSAGLNSGTAVMALALDFGFAFANCTAGEDTVSVADSTMFSVGMPVVIGGVGNSGGTSALLTLVESIDSTTTITLQDAPAATNASAPVGTGNLWGPSPNGFPTPTAALPYLARGPALVLDPRQALARCVSVTTTNGGATGGTFTIAGYDLFGQAMTELLTHPGGAATAYSEKEFKYISSVTPNFTDAQSYSVGTGDQFEFPVKVTGIEQTVIWWNGAQNVASTGFVAAVATDPSTTTSGDVRGYMLVSSAGIGGTGMSADVSNGSISSLAMSGRRLWMSVQLAAAQQIGATQANPVPMFGVEQNAQ